MPCGDVDDVVDDNSVEDMDEFKWKYRKNNNMNNCMEDDRQEDIFIRM